MNNYKKYTKQFFLPPERCMDWAEKSMIESAPVWCSVDLRDGNQSLVEPMDLQTKIEFFKLLVRIGFKEIEVGFPAASETEYAFMRALIDGGLIPDDVTVQVLTQAREHIIKRTFEAVKGAKNVIVHVYNSTSVAQREQVFGKDRQAIKKIAVDGARLLKQLAEQEGARYRFEYSPESFTGTEPEYALEVCNAVLDVWQPSAERKAIINLPATVENAMPHVYAQQVEYMNKHLKYRDGVVLSLHPHNDRGCGVAAAETGLLAGADRMEGTLFGNGERTGNVDIITLAMNMYSQGVDPGLDFSDMPAITQSYKMYTGMPVSPRQPYAGELVFAAFSGSHQDAIAKGMAFRERTNRQIWDVPYLPIDPKDVGREYESDVIRINSQSGKGGVGYVMQTAFGINMPRAMKEDMGYKVKHVSDVTHSELKPADIYEVFKNNYLQNRPVFDITECHFRQIDGIEACVSLSHGGKVTQVISKGNGRLDAVSNALKAYFGKEYTLSCYEQHALTQGSRSKAISYVGVEADGRMFFGAGVDDDIIKSSYKALVSAVNNMLKA
ncbi:MAG TPA: 2-isopropylmalate synthase [Candidatus Coproplasma avicola]|uniref:2-isopropylmalate synthase n=1 Tax=Candidatus Coproplasma avicola TaxID=2840744 RepID=A0A9D1E7W4_9FIRM|nr:2-isopropylmalate synthase [Candidatus Coproplasma avicola]